MDLFIFNTGFGEGHACWDASRVKACNENIRPWQNCWTSPTVSNLKPENLPTARAGTSLALWFLSPYPPQLPEKQWNRNYLPEKSSSTRKHYMQLLQNTYTCDSSWLLFFLSKHSEKQTGLTKRKQKHEWSFISYFIFKISLLFLWKKSLPEYPFLKACTHYTHAQWNQEPSFQSGHEGQVQF